MYTKRIFASSKNVYLLQKRKKKRIRKNKNHSIFTKKIYMYVI